MFLFDYRRDGERRVAVDVNVLYVSSRFARCQTIRGGCETVFPGYGECMHIDSSMFFDIYIVCFLPAAELYIRGDRAYLLRLGINPRVRHRVCENIKPHATMDN